MIEPENVYMVVAIAVPVTVNAPVATAPVAVIMPTFVMLSVVRSNPPAVMVNPPAVTVSPPELMVSAPSIAIDPARVLEPVTRLLNAVLMSE